MILDLIHNVVAKLSFIARPTQISTQCRLLIPWCVILLLDCIASQIRYCDRQGYGFGYNEEDTTGWNIFAFLGESVCISLWAKRRMSCSGSVANRRHPTNFQSLRMCLDDVPRVVTPFPLSNLYIHKQGPRPRSYVPRLGARRAARINFQSRKRVNDRYFRYIC